MPDLPSEKDETMDPAPPAPAAGSHPSPPPAQELWADIMDQEDREGSEPAKTEGALLEERRALRRQHSLESLAAFGDSEVEVPRGLDLDPLGRELFLSHHLSPAAARPYQEVVGRVTSHLRLKGDLQDALTATCRQSSFRTEIDTNQAFQA